MTLRQFWNALIGLRRLQTRQYQNQWEQFRFLAFHNRLPNVKNPDRMKFADIAKFPWDKKIIKRQGDKERFEYLKKRWN